MSNVNLTLHRHLMAAGFESHTDQKSVWSISGCVQILDLNLQTNSSYLCLKPHTHDNPYIQWGKKVFSQPPIVQVLPLKKMREACNFHHRYTSTMRDKIRNKNPENHIVGFLKNLFANYGGK